MCFLLNKRKWYFFATVKNSSKAHVQPYWGASSLIVGLNMSTLCKCMDAQSCLSLDCLQVPKSLSDLK